MVFQKVAKILSEIIEADPEDITPETELTPNNGMDAVSVAKLVIASEKKFGIIVRDEEVHTWKNVKDVVGYIEKTLADI